MYLNMGLQGQGAMGAGYDGASLPAAAGTPQGPTSIGQKAFGIVSGGGADRPVAGLSLLSAGVLSLVGLIWIWYSLPR